MSGMLVQPGANPRQVIMSSTPDCLSIAQPSKTCCELLERNTSTAWLKFVYGNVDTRCTVRGAVRRPATSHAQLTASVQGWVNHVRYGNTVGLRKGVLSRMVIPKQMRKPVYE